MDYSVSGINDFTRENYGHLIFEQIRQIWDFFLYSSLYLAVAAIGMAYISCTIQDLAFSSSIAAILSMVVFSVYNLNRKTDEAEDALNHASRFKITNSNSKLLLYLAIAAYAVALCIGASHNIAALAVTTVPLISGILYSSPILPETLGYSRLKEIPLVKNLVVSLAWGCAFSLIPVTIHGSYPDISSQISFIFIFCWTFIASILPDIRDMNGDAAIGIITIPVMLGIARTRLSLTAFNLVSGIMLMHLARGILPVCIIAVMVISFVYSEGCILTIGMIGKDDLLCDVISDGQFLIIGLVGYLINLGYSPYVAALIL